MGLISKTVVVRWNASNKNHFISKGYIFTKMKDELEVRVEDLRDGSHQKVEVMCDGQNCKKPNMKPIGWYSFVKNVKEDGKYYCQPCANGLYATENARKTKLKNGKSFEQWCYDNLSKELADMIISRWDYELNVDKFGNKLTPRDVSHSSAGINRKGFWFKCLDHPEHKSEQKSIERFVIGQHGSMECNQCKVIATTNPEIVKYLVDANDAYIYSYRSNKKIKMRCPNCGHVKDMCPDQLYVSGFACPKCSDGISYPEKIMFSMLDQLNIPFSTQLCKTTFDWCKNYRYDFYIPSTNGIIEIQGMQHYEEGFNKSILNKNIKTLKELQENDRVKKELALKNGIKNYIVIDCRYSELEFIKNNITNSELSKLFDLSTIDWLKCHEYACGSLVKKACDLWNGGINTTIGVANELKMSRGTAIKYLKQGAMLGLCNYKLQSNKVI